MRKTFTAALSAGALVLALLPAPKAEGPGPAPAGAAGLFKAAQGGFSFTKVSNRIFTPDAPDAAHNRACFEFENPESQEVSIRVFDLAGARVRRNVDIRVGSAKLCWDGRDDKGSVVKGGVYIYQLETTGTVRTGTVVVAR